jgi:hypothetical protein
VFMVVVSSGVLAATQWQNVSPTGQYGILFAYTLAFWGASVWIGKREQLRLTARMLAIATLLIIPVNVWMMDGLKVSGSIGGMGLVAIASILLTIALITLLRLPVGLPPAPNFPLTIFNTIGLSALHWGWGWPSMPLIATYIGTSGTAVCLAYQLSRPRRSPASPTVDVPLLSLGTIAIAFSTLLLLARATLVAGVPLSRLGLAFGLCGWVLCWVARPIRQQALWNRLGAALLVWGWLVSITVQPPWQAIAVSGLALWLLWDQLQATWRRGELLALLIVGLQAVWLVWFVLPESWRQEIVAIANTLTRYPVEPVTLAGVGGFLYLGWMVWLTLRLYRWQKPDLARQAELTSLIFGGVLTTLALTEPLVRSLNLLLSTLTLVIVLVNRRATGPFLIYLTHSVGLATLLSWINFEYPDLSAIQIAVLLILFTVTEWSFSGSNFPLLWRQSAWYLGLFLATLAYIVLASHPPVGYLALIWLIPAIALTMLANRPSFPHPRLAIWLTLVTLLLQLPLLNSLDAAMIALATATLLMALNTRRLRQIAMASLTVGFGLSFVSTVIWRYFAEQLTGERILILVAIAIAVLWLLWGWLRIHQPPLRTYYAIAVDGWATALSSVNLAVLSLLTIEVYIADNQTSWLLVIATGLMSLAVAYRIWQQPTEQGYSYLAWAGELLVAHLIAQVNPSISAVATGTLILAAIAQLTADARVRLTGRSYWLSWHGIPIGYAILGFVLAHLTWTATTGYYTLVAALVGIGVGRRDRAFQPLTYLALLGISGAAYELLIYQLLQAQGGSHGDGLVCLAGLAALIALGDRLLSPRLLPYFKINLQGLQTIAHLHWLGGNTLLGLALFTDRSRLGSVVWLGVAAILASYALTLGNRFLAWEGHRSTTPTATVEPAHRLWTYLGIWEAIILITCGLDWFIIDADALLTWGGAIASVVALALYSLPWDTWGWPLNPWKRSTSGLPGIVILLTAGQTNVQTLLITGAFYAWIARQNGYIRLSYISVFLVDWAIFKYLDNQDWLEPLWISTMIGCSLLYATYVDPDLQATSDRDKRHLLRTLATGLIGLTALYQAEVETGTTAIVFSLLTLGFSIGLILAGLILRVRAFLYMGTAIFILRVLRSLWLFIHTYSLLLWAIGIVIGLTFIWIAATFEARRYQVSAFVQYWISELDEWE